MESSQGDMDFPEDFDPRLEHYNHPDSKRYHGFGGRIQDGLNGPTKSVVVRVSKIPEYFSALALKNLFGQYAKINLLGVKTSECKSFMEAYVEYFTCGDVINVFRMFDKKGPFFFDLYVMETESQEPEPEANSSSAFPCPIDEDIQDKVDRCIQKVPSPFLPSIYIACRGLSLSGLIRPLTLAYMFEQSISLPDDRRVSDGRLYYTRPKETSREGSKKMNLLSALEKFNIQESGKEPKMPVKKEDCAFCGILSNSWCQRCKKEFYCSIVCQEKHWSKHKLVCRESDGGTTTECSSSQVVSEKKKRIERGVVRNVFLATMDPSSSTDFYVHLEDEEEALDNLYDALNERMSVGVQSLKTAVLGLWCCKRYEEAWCRACIIRLHPLTIFYQDYGNEEEVTFLHELKEIPRELCSHPPFAIYVHLAEGLSEADSQTAIPMRFLWRRKYAQWIVEIAEAKQSSSSAKENPPSRCEPNPHISLLPNRDDKRLDNYKNVIDVSKEKEKARCCVTNILDENIFTCFMIPDNMQDVVIPLLNMNLKDSQDKNYRPRMDEMVAVYEGDNDTVWERGIVLSKKNNSYFVAMVDYGLLKVFDSNHIKKLPDAYQNIPLLSVKLAVEPKAPICVENSDVLWVTLRQKLADENEWEVDVWTKTKRDDEFQLGVGRLSSWKIEPDSSSEPAYQELESGDHVVITTFNDINSIYVRPVTKQLKELYQSLPQELSAECIGAKKLDNAPFLGELVAARWSKDGNYYRVRILAKEKQRGWYDVLFVDYGNTDVVHYSAMRPISKKLKSVPYCAIKVGIRAAEDWTLTTAAFDYMIRVAGKNDLLKIEFEELNDVKLTKVKDLTDVNRDILELMKPSWIREPHFNTSSALVKFPMWQELPEPYEEDRFQIGKTKEILVSYVLPFETPVRNGKIEMYVCSANHRMLLVYNNILQSQMKSYIDHCLKNEPDHKYFPRRGELCICLAEGNIPLRAECLGIVDDRSVCLSYVDYGCRVQVGFENIFKMTSDLMQLPAFATCCFAEGIPESTTYEQVRSVQLVLDVCEAEIKNYAKEHYTIHIPELIARLI